MQLEDAYSAHLLTQFEKHEPGCTWLCSLESKQELFYSAMLRRFFEAISHFFIMDLADLVRKTRDTQLEYADNSEHLTGCVGYECTYSLADALEAAECPNKVFCLEGEPMHLARTDSSCDHHPGTTTGLRQVVINLVKLQVEVR